MNQHDSDSAGGSHSGSDHGGSTGDREPAASRALRLALRLYPAGYRAERAEEMAAVYADSTAHGGRLVAARELVGIAGYGLRVRGGLTAAGVGGRLMAVAAPLALAAGVGRVVRMPFQLGNTWASMTQASADNPAAGHWFVILWAATGILWLLAAVAAVLGRWGLVRPLVGLSVLAAVAQAVAFDWLLYPAFLAFRLDLFLQLSDADYFVETVGPALIWALMVFAAPRDLLGTPATRRPRALLVPLVVLAASASQNQWHLNSLDSVELWGVVGLSLGLLTLGALRWSRLLPVAVGLVTLPVALYLLTVARVPNLEVPVIWLGPILTYGVEALLLALVTAGAVRYLTPRAEKTQLIGS
ncbi:hypothetical protein GCM10009665_40390 [Kitasatospora nipponensis]|uniref:Uncharacterized protein n=1 Tax=Kitasatospora nipponensis TaxID=258049 RepID=A0ABP4H091_9ACTN